MDQVKIGIIGMGNMGSTHARHLLADKVPGAVLGAICDLDESKKDAFKETPFFQDAIAMMNSGKADAVLIATPHYDHTTLGVEALNRGLHTLVEKPISVHKEDAEKLIAAHQDSKVIFSAMFNQRTDPKYRKLKELIDSGELGQIRRINWIITDWFRTEYYYASGGWRATWKGEGGGVLLNQCPHQLDLWQWLFGMPSEVHAMVNFGKFHNIEVEDEVSTFMKYEDGKTGVFITTTGEAPGTNRLEVAAERGRVVLEGTSFSWIRNEVPTSEHSQKSPKGFEKPSVWNIDIPISGHGEQHIGIMKNFANAILKSEELVAPAKEGIHSVELANAMLLSGFENRPVTLPIDAAHYAGLLKEKIANSRFEKKTVAKGDTSDFSQSF